MKKFGRPNDGPGFVRNRGDDRGFSRGGGRGGFDERAQPRSFGRADGRPNDFQARSGGDDRSARKTYRREDGQRGGYGRGSAPRGDFRQTRPMPGASSAPYAPPQMPPTAPPSGRALQATPVSAAALKVGIAQANKALGGVIEQFGSTIRGDYDISQVEVAVSFDADGRFVGFGTGSAVSFTLTVTPLEGEDVFAADDDTQASGDEQTFELGDHDFEDGPINESGAAHAQDASRNDSDAPAHG